MLSLNMNHCLFYMSNCCFLQFCFYLFFDDSSERIKRIEIVIRHSMKKKGSHHKTMRDDVIDFGFFYYHLLHALFMVKLCDKNHEIVEIKPKN